FTEKVAGRRDELVYGPVEHQPVAKARRTRTRSVALFVPPRLHTRVVHSHLEAGDLPIAPSRSPAFHDSGPRERPALPGMHHQVSAFSLAARGIGNVGRDPGLLSQPSPYREHLAAISRRPRKVKTWLEHDIPNYKRRRSGVRAAARASACGRRLPS